MAPNYFIVEWDILLVLQYYRFPFFLCIWNKLIYIGGIVMIKHRPTIFEKTKSIFVHPKSLIFHANIIVFRTKILEQNLNVYSLYFHISLYCSHLIWYKRKNAEFMIILKLDSQATAQPMKLLDTFSLFVNKIWKLTCYKDLT